MSHTVFSIWSKPIKINGRQDQKPQHDLDHSRKFFFSIRWSIASVHTQIYYVRSSICIGTQHISWHTHNTRTQHACYCSVQIMWPRFFLLIFFFLLAIWLFVFCLNVCPVVSCCNLTYIRTSTVYSNECRVWSREPLLFVYVLFVIERDT